MSPSPSHSPQTPAAVPLFGRRQSGGTDQSRVRRSAHSRCRPAGSRGYAHPHLARGLALGADRHDRGDDPAMRESAILAAVFYRLHPAQYRIFLPSDRVDATVTFLIFPGTGTAPLDRIPWYDILLFALTFAAAIWLMLNIRKAAQFGWEFEGAPKNVIASRPRNVVRADGGAAAAPAAGACCSAYCRSRSIRCLPDAKWLGPFRGTQSTLQQTTAYHMLSGESLLGIPIQAFADTVIGFAGVRHRADDDGRRQVFHQCRVRDVRHVPRWRRQGLRVCERTARHRRRQHRFQRADRGHHDHPGDEKDRLHSVLIPARSKPAPPPARYWRRRC